jgi:hypothetical protein
VQGCCCHDCPCRRDLCIAVRTRSGQLLSWLRLFVFFLGPSRQEPWQYSHDRFLPYPFQFSFPPDAMWSDCWQPEEVGAPSVLILYCSILLHCVDLTLRFAFMPSMCNVGYYSLVVFLYGHYIFRPNQPSSGIQVMMIIKKFTAFYETQIVSLYRAQKSSPHYCNRSQLNPVNIASSLFSEMYFVLCFLRLQGCLFFFLVSLEKSCVPLFAHLRATYRDQLILFHSILLNIFREQ